MALAVIGNAIYLQKSTQGSKAGIRKSRTYLCNQYPGQGTETRLGNGHSHFLWVPWPPRLCDYKCGAPCLALLFLSYLRWVHTMCANSFCRLSDSKVLWGSPRHKENQRLTNSPGVNLYWLHLGAGRLILEQKSWLLDRNCPRTGGTPHLALMSHESLKPSPYPSLFSLLVFCLLLNFPSKHAQRK